MRQLIQGQTVAPAGTFTSERFFPGNNREAWRLFPGTLRVVNDGAGTCNVSAKHGITGEIVVDVVAVPGNGGISSKEFKVPGDYFIDVDTVVDADVILTIYLDGDT